MPDRSDSAASPARRFRERLARPGPLVVAGAHHALSARLAQEAGFDGVWASGFEISATRAVPDANILTMAESLEVARQMAEAIAIPVLADCDNGFGNAINVIRTVQQYERAGIAGVCIEDNVFPKRCSFYAGVQRDLATVEEHAGKVRAAIGARASADFVVVARTEALIAGWGLGEALTRARAYADAGADLVLVHSKERTVDELAAFAARWDRPTPLVAVPTIYKDVTAEDLAALGFKVVIFANHALRSAVKAMQTTLAALRGAGSAAAADPYVVPLDEIYRLVGVPELRDQERTFLPAGGAEVRAVILAAGDDTGLGSLTSDRPRCLLDVKGRTILERQVELLRAAGITNVAVVRGYRKDAIDVPGVRTYDNDSFATTGEAVSLFAARAFLEGRVLVLYGDVLFDRSILDQLLRADEPVAIAVDRSWAEHRGAVANGAGVVARDLVELETPAPLGPRQISLDGPSAVRRIGRGLEARAAHAEFIGLALFDGDAVDRLCATWDRLVAAAGERDEQPFREAPSLARAALTDLLSERIAAGERVAAVQIWKGWMEVDSFDDYRRMWAEVAS